MKLLIEVEIGDNDLIEEGSDWPPHLERYKSEGQIPQQVKSVSILKNYIIGPVGDKPIQELEQKLIDNGIVAYEWAIFLGPDLTLKLVQEVA